MVVNANVIVATYIKCMKENLITLKHQYNIFLHRGASCSFKKVDVFLPSVRWFCPPLNECYACWIFFNGGIPKKTSLGSRSNFIWP